MLDLLRTFKKCGIFVDVISQRLGNLVGMRGATIAVNRAFVSTYSVLYDTLYVVGGKVKNQEKFDYDVVNFVNEAYKHYKPIGVNHRQILYTSF